MLGPFTHLTNLYVVQLMVRWGPYPGVTYTSDSVDFLPYSWLCVLAWPAVAEVSWDSMLVDSGRTRG